MSTAHLKDCVCRWLQSGMGEKEIGEVNRGPASTIPFPYTSGDPPIKAVTSHLHVTEREKGG